ncbi:hypothetical protein MRX96_039564 [Rhipicephalus microplus]
MSCWPVGWVTQKMVATAPVVKRPMIELYTLRGGALASGLAFLAPVGSAEQRAQQRNHARSSITASEPVHFSPSIAQTGISAVFPYAIFYAKNDSGLAATTQKRTSPSPFVRRQTPFPGARSKVRRCGGQDDAAAKLDARVDIDGVDIDDV